MDGSDACQDQTNFAAVFTVSTSDPTTATYTLGPISFTATLTAPTQPAGASVGDLGTKITLVNSAYQGCISVGYKTVAYVYTGESSTGVAVSSTGPSYPALDYASMMVAPYDFDTSCTPSKTCCCGTNTLTIGYNGSAVITSPASTEPMSSLGAILVDASFDGGLGCFGMSSIVALFSIDSPTTASYETAGIK
jgi:hypothetical protein